MLFNSFQFAVFFPLVLAVYYFLPHRKQNIFLLIASCIFYASWNWRFLFPLLFSTSIDYFCAYRMQDLLEAGAPDESRHKYLLISVITNLGLLGFFKYFNFFTNSVAGLLQAVGLHPDMWTLRVLLPVGISFYTFQALSYTIDVYRGQIHPTRNFLDFLLAILYFPHLVAGPIQRAHSLLPQVMKPREITAAKVLEGVHLIVCGYFKKVFIADNLAPIVDQIFSSPHPDGFHTILAAYTFAIQIYCDFSGYTDIARGIAKVMGFEFMLNFNLPFFAVNPADFWNRWHISLSSWLRDYLFIPLALTDTARRIESIEVAQGLAVLLTFVISGLWHGAAWTFVLWGFYHGVIFIIHQGIAPWRHRFSLKKWVGPSIAFVASVFLMMQFTAYGFLLFRAASFAQIGQMTHALLRPFQGYDPALLQKVLLLSSPLIVVQLIQYYTKRLDFLAFDWIPAELRVAAYSAAAYFVLFLGGQPQAFIYFQF